MNKRIRIETGNIYAHTDCVVRNTYHNWLAVTSNIYAHTDCVLFFLPQISTEGQQHIRTYGLRQQSYAKDGTIHYAIIWKLVCTPFFKRHM